MISERSSSSSSSSGADKVRVNQLNQELAKMNTGGQHCRHGRKHCKEEDLKSHSRHKRHGKRPFYGSSQDKERHARSISPGRKARKDAQRQTRRKEFQEIFKENKLKNPYYDTEKDTYLAEAYYLRLGKVDYESLNELISSTFKHARRRQNLFPIIDRHPDYTLRCVYSGTILSDAQGNMLLRCDEEHSFPQSFQRGKRSGTGRDMHAIFAASKSANGSRGNMPFGMISPDDKLIEESDYGKIYANKSTRRTYVPKINAGAIARTTLYVLTCYKACANPSYFSKDLLPWLVNTAANQPVSDWEKHRNATLFELQGNRNPFIDHPDWALKVNFSKGWQE